MKMFNLYWCGTTCPTWGSPHSEDFVIDQAFNGALSEQEVKALDALEINEKHVDEGGDTWERIA